MPTTRSQTIHERVPSAPADAPPDNASANLRPREKATARRARSAQSDEPPRFTIDLSLPAEQRYLEVCAAMKSEIKGLTSLFDDVVVSAVPIPGRWLHHLCHLFLRKIHNDEENAELQGISQATGVAMYLLVCFNVLLDLFMGCSSGGAAVQDEHGTGVKMLHFRTLDWDMPALRRIVVHLDFVEAPDGPVVASSITYAGFIGVLTGVRKDLSMSLNFRPTRNAKSSLIANVLYMCHMFLVLMGLRPSIASILRSYLLPPLISPFNASYKSQGFAQRRCIVTALPRYEDVIKHFAIPRTFASTACYLCFCDGMKTTVIEKDRVTAKLRSSNDFIVITNNDQEAESSECARNTDHSPPPPNASLAELLAEAQDRKQCAEHNWHHIKATRSMSNVADVVELVQKYPTTNEMTHFACVMDAKAGTIRWCRRWRKPVGSKWISDHMSETW